MKYIAAVPVVSGDSSTISREGAKNTLLGFKFYMFEFHNHVNHKTGSPRFRWEACKQKYDPSNLQTTHTSIRALNHFTLIISDHHRRQCILPLSDDDNKRVDRDNTFVTFFRLLAEGWSNFGLFRDTPPDSPGTQWLQLFLGYVVKWKHRDATLESFMDSSVFCYPKQDCPLIQSVWRQFLEIGRKRSVDRDWKKHNVG